MKGGITVRKMILPILAGVGLTMGLTLSSVPRTEAGAPPLGEYFNDTTSVEIQGTLRKVVEVIDWIRPLMEEEVLGGKIKVPKVWERIHWEITVGKSTYEVK